MGRGENDEKTKMDHEEVEGGFCDKFRGFPKCIGFIVGNEFCERFSFYGMKAILTIYLLEALLFDDSTSTAIYHAFTFGCYFTPILGAIMADSWLGKYWTIVSVSVVYCLGHLIMSLSDLVGPEPYPFRGPSPSGKIPGAMIGLVLIALGTGGIKPCVSAFGGDQFKDGQTKQVQMFFSIFYFAINAGSLISTLVTPLLRDDVQCYGADCFPLAFGVPAILMVVATILFVVGTPFYKRNPPQGNVVVLVSKAIGNAVKNRWNRESGEQRDHWMDYCDTTIYEKKLVRDIKFMLHVLYMYIPLPVFWALFDQQGSRWTLQAYRMNYDLGPLGKMKPDQIQFVNPALILILIPIFEGAIYPILDKCKIPNRPLQRMCAGMTFAAGAFVVAGFIQIALQNTYPQPPAAGNSGLRVINLANCDLQPTFNPALPGTDAPSFEPIAYKGDQKLYDVPMGNHTLDFSCTGKTSLTAYKVDMGDQEFNTVIITDNNGALSAPSQFHTEWDKPEKADPKMRVIFMLDPATVGNNVSVRIENSDAPSQVYHTFDAEQHKATEYVVKEPGKFNVKLEYKDTSGESQTETVGDGYTTEHGGGYTVVVYKNTEYEVNSYIDAEPSSMSILFQIPQYFIITTGEVLFSVTGLDFSYSQAPKSMKSVLQAAWLLTVAFGNVIVLIVAEARLIEDQAIEFFMFAGLMGAVVIIFAIMSYFYTYNEIPKDDEEMEELGKSATNGDVEHGKVKNGVDNPALTTDGPVSPGVLAGETSYITQL
ncbi:PREDICTED: solute carrier family 15 member 1-like isoform X1 [Branchiostoma belcheri]|uniref:Solute carrier family 15 member 1-like isoform X1 n=1 Tax=Branchiostoma belcheri TaxID=7741 RepID=A0A6P4ZK08_BRABE|nr:PREDICTED: solute carrier family 15 member 1-like isoform X1 [Branchiostoma belcheri]